MRKALIMIISAAVILTACAQNPNDGITGMESVSGQPEIQGAAALPEGEYPASFSWLDEGVVMTPQDQMPLGTCAVFAATGMFETYIARFSGELVDLSEQQYIMTDPGWNPDVGVSPESVLEFYRDNGVVTEEKLPYSVEDALGRTETGDYGFDYRLDADWGSEGLSGKTFKERIEIIKSCVLYNGPVCTVIDYYRDFKYYSGGVYHYDGKSEELGGHWINIIGWADDKSVMSGGYWICKNSFGTEWGEGGYCRIAYGDGCDVDNHMIYFIYSQEVTGA